jgi:nucleoside-diphosphate-sugar epimerase
MSLAIHCSTNCYILSYSPACERKAKELRVLYTDNLSIKVVKISDIVHSQFQDALAGIDAVIYVASPLLGHANGCTFSLWNLSFPFKTSKLSILLVGHSLNVLQQAERAGIKKFVVTSSMTLLGDPTMKGMDRAEHTLFFLLKLRSDLSSIMYFPL